MSKAPATVRAGELAAERWKRRRGRPRKPESIAAFARRLGIIGALKPGPRRSKFTTPKWLDRWSELIALSRQTKGYKTWRKRHCLRDSDKAALRYTLEAYETDTRRHGVVDRLDSIYQQLVRHRRSVAR